MVDFTRFCEETEPCQVSGIDLIAHHVEYGKKQGAIAQPWTTVN
jgi:hypothetical protein